MRVIKIHTSNLSITTLMVIDGFIIIIFNLIKQITENEENLFLYIDKIKKKCPGVSCDLY